MRKSIAVIGAGISGLGAAWILSKQHDVTIYERNGYAGGHSNTVDAPVPGGSVPVDTGFIVYNYATYPNLCALFDRLNVQVSPTAMSFAVSRDNGALEYGGGSLGQLFAQKRNWVSPRFHLMVQDILRFYRSAPAALANGSAAGLDLGTFLAQGRYGKAFVEDHLLPMAAAIWSCPTDQMTAFPAASFIRFFINHGLLQVQNRPVWWTVQGGSRRYVQAILDDLPNEVSLRNPARRILRGPSGVLVTDDQGHEARFDEVVVATHGDEALALLGDAAPEERAILSRFRYSRNVAWLHDDAAQMPRRRNVWSAWNYLRNSREDAAAEKAVSVTYWMNRLQNLRCERDLFVTLNPVREIADEHVIGRFEYDHPIFDSAAVAAQTTLPEIQGARHTWFCGSYCGYGFHEDGLASAVAVARALGVEAPWGHMPHHAMAAVGSGAPAPRMAVPEAAE